MHDRVRRLLPPSGLARALSWQAGLYAVGTGVFLTGNAVYFTRIVGLSAGRVGLGISIAGVVAVLVSVPAGRLADRIGTRRTWAAAATLEALVYLLYPSARGFGEFVGVVVAVAVMESTGRAARGAYALAAIPRGERVRSLAFVRSAMNVGFTFGAMLSGLALSTGSRDVISAVPLLTCVLLLVNAALISRLPDPVDGTATRPAVHHPGTARRALHNRPFLALSILSGQLGVNQVLLSVVFPLWLVDRTDAPHALLAWMYGTNTVMAVFLQVPASRGAESVHGAVRAARLAAVSIALACSLTMTSNWTRDWLTMAVLWTGYVLLTSGELFNSASSWGFVAELTDPARRAEYQGVWRLGTQVQMVLGPAVFTWLAVTWNPLGMLAIAAWVGVVVLAMPRFAYAAQRVLENQGAPVAHPKPRSATAPGTDTIGQSDSS